MKPFNYRTIVYLFIWSVLFNSQIIAANTELPLYNTTTTHSIKPIIARPLLKDIDIKMFIETFPKMYQEYRKLGLKVDPQTGKVEGDQQIKRDKEVNRILQENGWNFMFWPKLQTIFRGYSVAKYDQVTSEHGQNLEKLISDLKNSKWMTPEKKAELEAFYSQMKNNFAKEAARLRKKVHANDLSLIKKSISGLDIVMQEVVKIEVELAQQPQNPTVTNEPKPGSAFLTQLKGSATSKKGKVKKLTVVREKGGRVSWSKKNNWIVFDKKGADGYYDLYLIRSDGTEESCLTCDMDNVLSKGHKGTAEWHPSGKYIVFQVQKKQYTGKWGLDKAADPGNGRYSDLWLMDVSTKKAYQLTRTKNSHDTGVLHPHFSNDGKKLTWSEMYLKPKAGVKGQQIGFWKIMVSDFNMVSNTPELNNLQSFEPGKQGFYENHGLSPDNRKLLFTSSFEMKNLFDFFDATNIYQYDLNSKKLDKLASEKYNEHAHYAPSGKEIVWMTSKGNVKKGTDFWRMDINGNNKQRLTDFNNPQSPSYKNKLIITADASFSPDGKKLMAFVQDGLSYEGALVLIELGDEALTASGNDTNLETGDQSTGEDATIEVNDTSSAPEEVVTVSSNTKQLLYLHNRPVASKDKRNGIEFCEKKSGLSILKSTTTVTHNFGFYLGGVQKLFYKLYPSRTDLSFLVKSEIRSSSGEVMSTIQISCAFGELCKYKTSETVVLPKGTYYLVNESVKPDDDWSGNAGDFGLSGSAATESSMERIK